MCESLRANSTPLTSQALGKKTRYESRGKRVKRIIMTRLAVISTKERKLDVLYAVDPRASHTYCAAEKRELCALRANDPLRTV